MTGNVCHPKSPSRFNKVIAGLPDSPSDVERDLIVPLVFFHPRTRRQFSTSLRCLSLAEFPLRYGRSVSTISGQSSFVFIHYLLINFIKNSRFVIEI